MLMQIEGSLAVAQAVALCKPHVISCYPITPQTHIVEELSAIVKAGKLGSTVFLNVESEFAALSALIGAANAGARTYTATSSQGLLFMAEALFNASGLGLPIVMTDGNRAIGAPINIWNDHSDTMCLRDCGWIQLHAQSNQEAVDLHIQAFRIAEELSTPVLVCMDGFILTHAYERVDMPTQEQVDEFLPPFAPRQTLDPRRPLTIGALVGPEAYFEVKVLQHRTQLRALEVIPRISLAFERHFGRAAGGFLTPYKMDDAEIAVIAMGSVNGTIQEAVDELRDLGVKIGSVALSTYRPFPFAEVASALQGASRVVVVEKYLAPGMGGCLAADITQAIGRRDVKLFNLIVGLGGRAILQSSLAKAFIQAQRDELKPLSFLDIHQETLDREAARLADAGSPTHQAVETGVSSSCT